MELGRNVIRPAIAGLIGALVALYMRRNTQKQTSHLIIQSQSLKVSYTSTAGQCKGCTANCSIQ